MPPIEDLWDFYEAVRAVEEELADVGATAESFALRQALQAPSSREVLGQLWFVLRRVRQSEAAELLGLGPRLDALIRRVEAPFGPDHELPAGE